MAKMIFTFSIYFFLLISIVICAKFANYRLKIGQIEIKHATAYILIIIYTLIIGLRYDVGVDYLLYKETFINSTYSNAGFIASNNWGTFEPAFSAIIYFFAKLNWSYAWLFISIAFLHIVFLYKFSQQYSYLTSYLFYFYLTSATFFDSLNMMRQATAFFMFLCILHYIQERKLLNYLIAIIIISLFHRSIVIMLPLYFILHRNLFPKKSITICLLLISFIFGYSLENILYNKIFPFIYSMLTNLADSSYLLKRDDLTLSLGNTSIGLAKFIVLGIALCIILKKDSLSNFYKTTNINIFYNLFIIGSFIYFISDTSITIIRLNAYFFNIQFVMMAFLTYMLIKSSQYKNFIGKINLIFLFTISLAWFINAILHGTKISPFQFIN